MYQSLFVSVSYLEYLPIGAVSHRLNELKDANRILERQRKQRRLLEWIRIYRTLNTFR